MDVYKGRLEKFKNTQSIQWKMNLSIWTLLVLAIYKNDIIILNTYLMLIILFSICVIHFRYCSLTQKSLNDDKAVNIDIINQLNEIGQKNVIVDLTIKGKHSNWPWVYLQTIITGILAIVLYKIIY